MMTAIMKKHLKKNKKGFTLIEVVVVLVILAILAAIAVPALTGYINDAKERSAQSEARSVLVGLQHLASTNKSDNSVTSNATGYFNNGVLSTAGVTKINTLTGMTLSITNPSGIVFDGDTITEFTYTSDDSVKVYYYNKGYHKSAKS